MNYDRDTDFSEDSFVILTYYRRLCWGTAAVDWSACVTRATWLPRKYVTVRLRQL